MTTRVDDGPPGSELQIDFGDLGLIPAGDGRRRKLRALVFTAAFSRFMFVYLTFSMTLEEVIAAFDGVFAGNGTRVIKTPVRSPRANSFAERFVGTLRRECPDHVVILGERHLREVLAEYARHHNSHRPHQGRQQEPRCASPATPSTLLPGSSVGVSCVA